MEKFFYAQLNIDNICTGVSELKGEVPEYNYQENKQFNPITGEWTFGEPIFISRMIRIPFCSENYLGLKYNDETQKWEQAEEEIVED